MKSFPNSNSFATSVLKLWTPLPPGAASGLTAVAPALREMRDFMVAARTLLEGDDAQSVAAVNRIVASDFRDPEGLFYLARHLARLQQVPPALELFERVVEGGFFCFPAMTHDPWLDPLRKKPAFAKRLRQAETQHREAVAAFIELQGERVLSPIPQLGV